ncbi:MAG: hypothetical protein V7K40_25390 [Nostoc sp.]|uniref:hypothetical protein n=1 Tax=Nostoc sp. TaxID=1180 RepID=UPI002FF8E9BC
MREINKINKRRKSGGFYLNQTELIDILEQGYQVGTEKSGARSFGRAQRSAGKDVMKPKN